MNQYSKEMLQAHEDTVFAYENFIAFAKNKDNSLEVVQIKAVNFYVLGCNYCYAASDAPEDNKTNLSYSGRDCSKCLLGVGSSYTPCGPHGPITISYENTRGRHPEVRSRKQLVKAFEHRLDDLVLQAEFNLGEE